MTNPANKTRRRSKQIIYINTTKPTMGFNSKKEGINNKIKKICTTFAKHCGWI